MFNDLIDRIHNKEFIIIPSNNAAELSTRICRQEEDFAKALGEAFNIRKECYLIYLDSICTMLKIPFGRALMLCEQLDIFSAYSTIANLRQFEHDSK